MTALGLIVALAPTAANAQGDGSPIGRIDRSVAQLRWEKRIVSSGGIAATAHADQIFEGWALDPDTTEPIEIRVDWNWTSSSSYSFGSWQTKWEFLRPVHS